MEKLADPPLKRILEHRWTPLLGILLLAACIRLATISLASIHHPDELWQYIEPANGIVFDRWVIPWEYRAGIRSWLIPVLLAAPMALGHVLAPGSSLFLILPKILVVLVSLVVVAYSAAFGLRLSRLHGLVAGFVAATWVELVQFAPRTMSEPLSLALFLPAAYLLTLPSERLTRRNCLIAGLLLGLCFVVRFQLAPALLVLVLITCWGRLRETLPPLIVGGLAGLAVDGIVNAAMGQTPFLWIFENFRLNLVENKSAHYGVAPPQWYLTLLLPLWKAAILPILLLSFLGARRYPVLLAVAIVNIAAHSLIPHKEYRFVLLSTALIVLLAAIGTGEAVRWLARNASISGLRIRAVLACAIWAVTSTAIGLSLPYRDFWTSNATINTLRFANTVPGVCALALYDLHFPLGAARTYYRQDTPIYGFFGPLAQTSAVEAGSSFNLVMSHPGRAPEIGSDYRLLKCSDRRPGRKQFCVYQRPGGCAGPADPKYEINAALTRTGH
nr:mannosyltransferase [uncultured Sphingosinicella sp.]